jgi:hypothetical protein
MTVGSTNWVKSLYQRLPKPSLRAAHTVCVKLQRPVPDVALRSSRYRQLQLGGGLSRFEKFSKRRVDSGAWYNNLIKASHHDYTTGADREL